MSKLIGVVLPALLLAASMNPDRERFAKYKAVEAYEVRPGLLVLPTYSADGQVCAIGLEKLHYSAEMIRLDSNLSRSELDQIFEELVPDDERSPKLGRDLITMSGRGVTTTIDFKNVSPQITGKELSSSAQRGVVEDEIVAIIRWKLRQCQ
jgi:hypothetical protein